MPKQTLGRGVAALIVLTAAACARNKAADDANRYAATSATSEPPVPIGGGPLMVPVEVATDEIAEARCEREARCGNIGDDHAYVDRSDCLARLARQIVDELDTSHCPDGIEKRALGDCVREARGEACQSTGVRLCSAMDICRYPATHG